VQMTYGVPNVLTVGLMKIKNIGIRPLAVRLMKIENFKMQLPWGSLDVLKPKTRKECRGFPKNLP